MDGCKSGPKQACIGDDGAELFASNHVARQEEGLFNDPPRALCDVLDSQVDDCILRFVCLCQ